MIKKIKNILDNVAELGDRNQELFDKKAKLEEEILKIDLEIWQIGDEYQALFKNAIKELKNNFMKIIETIFQILSEPYILAFLTTVIIVIVLIVTQD